MYQHQITTLRSGLELITVPMAATSSVTTLFLSNVGSRYESVAQEGIAHFFEHMVFKGTAKYPDSQTLAVTIDAIGARTNAFTSKEYTGYYIKAASRHLSLALDVLTEMLFSPRLAQADIERERGVIIEEINMYEDTPMQNIGNLFDRLLFAGSGLEHDVIGSKATVSSLTRDDFIAFLRHFYHPSNLTLVVAGDEQVVRPEVIEPLLEKMLIEKADSATMGKARFSARADRLEASALIEAGRPTYGSELRLIQHKATEQVHLMMGWPGLARDDERRYALSLLTTILGGNMSSRLFTEVREKRGLCYYVHADADTFHQSGSVVAVAGVDPKRASEAIEVIQAECLALTDARPVSVEELVRAQEYATGSMQLSLEDSGSVAQFFGIRQLLKRKIETPTEVMAKLRQVTVKEVNQLARELLSSSAMRLALIGEVELADSTQSHSD